MKPFLYTIGGMLLLGALLIVSQAPRDPVVLAVAAPLAICGAVICWLNCR